VLRVRLTYTKSGGLRYTGNLDMHKIWERTMRRARLPLAYSQGFHPQPRINQASPLPLGMVSQVEMVEVWLEEDLELSQVESSLAGAVPPGMLIRGIQPVDLHAPSLPTLVRASVYRVILRDVLSPQELAGRVARFLALESCPRNRRGKNYDLRPLVQALNISAPSPAGEQQLEMSLSATEGATGRPDEVLLALELDPNAAFIERTAMILATPA
jgi:radical SAM-linked protein